MKMSRVHWKSAKTQRTIACLVAAFFLYIFIRKGSYEYRASVVLPNAKPYIVWEYVSDFSHMKHLNPTIEHFQVLSDSWSNGDWHYSVRYSENLSHWPYTPNIAIAHFTMKRDQKLDKYVIESKHMTCMFRGYYCLDTYSEFKFYTNELTQEGTVCEEMINYQCPVFLSGFCRREVEYQRRAIGHNLQKIFDV